MLNKRILVLMFLLVFLFSAGCFPTTPPIDENQAPVITSTPVSTATVGEIYYYNVGATDPDYDALTFSLIAKPAGMIINLVGLISWVPAVEGDYNVTVMVSDGVLSDTQSFTIEAEAVEDPCVPPCPPKVHTIIAFAGSGGSINPSGDVTVNEGSDKLFTITSTVFYRTEDVLVDGDSVGAVDFYNFNNVTKDHTISVTFILIAPVYNQDQDEHYNKIQLAIDDANVGDTILVMAGEYEEEDVKIYVDGLILKSVEKYGAEIKGRVAVQADDVTVEDFYINLDISRDAAPVDLMIANGVTIRGNKVEGGSSDAKGINTCTGLPGDIPVGAHYGSSSGNPRVHGLVLIEDNEIFGGCIGLMSENLPANVTIRNNTMTGPGHQGIWTYLIANTFLTIENNTVVGAGLNDVKIVEKPLSINGEADETKMAQVILDDNLGINSVYLEWL